MKREAIQRATGRFHRRARVAVPLAVMALLVGWGQLFAMVSGPPASGSSTEVRAPADRPAPATIPPASQDAGEAVMVAAGAWVLDRVPGGAGYLDPHRSGAGKDGSRLERVAGALGLGLATLDDVRECVDVMDPASCTLDVDRLLAMAAPQIHGDAARVKVYAWYRADTGGTPVVQRSWELRLARNDGVWQVVSGG